MLIEISKNIKFILASQSPRRQQLLKELIPEFEVIPVDVEEVFPPELQGEEIALYLSELKAKAFDENKICEDCLVITADTIVWQNGKILPKPVDFVDAEGILKVLSGSVHEVITGVSLRTKNKLKTFATTTRVYFKELTTDEIHFYINNYKPFDKAGAYGIQEWIGYIGIEKIEGSYFNVVGLPVQRLYTELIDFLKE